MSIVESYAAPVTMSNAIFEQFHQKDQSGQTKVPFSRHASRIAMVSHDFTNGDLTVGNALGHGR
jgi:hypothetical protein